MTEETTMEDVLWTAAIEAQLLMGHCAPAAHVAMDRRTVTGWSWDVDQVRQQLHVPLNTLWEQHVLALEMQGLASFSFYTTPYTYDEEGQGQEIPGWQDEPREQWGSVGIHARGVLRLAELYGRPYVRLEESPAVLAHWQLVQVGSAAALAALPRDAAHEAQWARNGRSGRDSGKPARTRTGANGRRDEAMDLNPVSLTGVLERDPVPPVADHGTQ